MQEAYNREHGIVPQTIGKEIRDTNDRLRAVAEASAAYGAEGRARELSQMSREEIAKLIGQMQAEMKGAARELEFERAAALRDEIQSIRLRVLEEDASVKVARDAERAAAEGRGQPPAAPTAKPSERAAARKAGERRGRRAIAAGEVPGLDVTSVTVLPAEVGHARHAQRDQAHRRAAQAKLGPRRYR